MLGAEGRTPKGKGNGDGNTKQNSPAQHKALKHWGLLAVGSECLSITPRARCCWSHALSCHRAPAVKHSPGSRDGTSTPFCWLHQTFVFPGSHSALSSAEASIPGLCTAPLTAPQPCKAAPHLHNTQDRQHTQGRALKFAPFSSFVC